MTSEKESEFAVDDEDMWVSTSHFSSNNALHSGLKDLEHSLRCPSCHEFMTAPVSIVPCQHTFCSECIRKHFKLGMRSLKRQALCPVCREQVKDSPPLFTKSLLPNRSMELVIRKFQALRGNLKDALQQNSRNENATTTNDASNEATATSDNSDTANSETSRPRRSKRTNYAEDDNNDDEFIPEPPAEAAIALDDTATAPPVQRKKKVPPEYSRLKKKKLREVCAEEGLSTAGSDDQLKRRHEDFVSLYNSECDSFHPRSHAELVQVISHREQECKKEATKSRYNGSGNHAQCMEQLKQNRKMIGKQQQQQDTASCASSGNEAFDTEMKNNFAKLIQQARQGMKKKKVASDGDDKSSRGDDTEQPGSMDETKENASSGENVRHDVEEESFSESKMAAVDTSLPKCVAEAQEAMAQTSSVDGNTAKDSPAIGQPSAGAELQDWVPAAAHPSDDTDKTASASAIASSHATHDTTKRKGTLNVVLRTSKKAKVPPVARERRTSAGGSIIGPWTCPLCTFHNTTRTYSKAKCAMCGTLRPSGANGSGDDYVAIDC